MYVKLVSMSIFIIVNSNKNDDHVCHSFKPVAHTSPCAYIYVLCHKESLVQVSLCFQTYLNNNY